jgi:hypothetical protein
MALAQQTHEHGPIAGLLCGILASFASQRADQLFSRTIVEVLRTIADEPWMNVKRPEEINEKWLGVKLRPYGISPSIISIGDQRARGYIREHFTGVFRRYIPRENVESALAGFDELRNRPEEPKATTPEVSAAPDLPASRADRQAEWAAIHARSRELIREEAKRVRAILNRHRGGGEAKEEDED